MKSKSLDNPYIRKRGDGPLIITNAGKAYLKGIITNTEEQVYVFTEGINPVTVAAAMARLSRRSDDMRITILDEFVGKAEKDEQLLSRVITQYGDDSVQQLVGLHVNVEGASNLLTKLLEWGRLAAYLEQSTRYIYYDQKEAGGSYKYVTPANLKPAIRKGYQKTLDTIFDLYSEVVHKLTDYIIANSSVAEAERDIAWKGAVRAQACDAARAMLPVATKSTVGIFGSGQAIESLIMHLLSEKLVEARQTGEAMLQEVRKVAPVFFERADKPERGGASIAFRANTAAVVEALAKKYLKSKPKAVKGQLVELVDYWPKNELDLVPYMLFDSTHASLKELKTAVKKWPRRRQLEFFDAYIGERLNRRHKPGRALEQAHYRWDIICDYGIFRDLQRHRMVDDLRWQRLTPYLSYEVPELVKKATLEKEFRKSFKLSGQLYKDLVKAGFEEEAQYVTLLGHKMRWTVMYNARAAFHLHELRTSPQGHPGYRQLVKSMHDQVAKVHPRIAAAMKFVNSDEDAELTRLAAERYTQFKLQQLDKGRGKR